MKNKLIILSVLALGMLTLIGFTSAMGMYGSGYNSGYMNENSGHSYSGMYSSNHMNTYSNGYGMRSYGNSMNGYKNYKIMNNNQPRRMSWFW